MLQQRSYANASWSLENKKEKKKKKRATVPSDCNKTGQELASMRLAPALPFDKIITAEGT